MQSIFEFPNIFNIPSMALMRLPISDGGQKKLINLFQLNVLPAPDSPSKMNDCDFLDVFKFFIATNAEISNDKLNIEYQIPN